MHVGSDIDIAILPVQKIHLQDIDRANIAAKLSNKIPYICDIGIISSSNLVYAR